MAHTPIKAKANGGNRLCAKRLFVVLTMKSKARYHSHRRSTRPSTRRLPGRGGRCQCGYVREPQRPFNLNSGFETTDFANYRVKAQGFCQEEIVSASTSR